MPRDAGETRSHGLDIMSSFQALVLQVFVQLMELENSLPAHASRSIHGSFPSFKGPSQPPWDLPDVKSGAKQRESGDRGCANHSLI